MPSQQVNGKEIGFARKSGAAIIGHDEIMFRVLMRRNALRLLRPTKVLTIDMMRKSGGQASNYRSRDKELL